jgi:hypothetical protein
MRLDEKLKPIPWAERPTGALVGAGSHWPWIILVLVPTIFQKNVSYFQFQFYMEIELRI